VAEYPRGRHEEEKKKKKKEKKGQGKMGVHKRSEMATGSTPLFKI